MGDEERNLTVYEQRITKVEAKVEYVVIEQAQQRAMIDRFAALLEALAKSDAEQKYQTQAVIARTEQHTTEIEAMTKEQVDMGKILASFAIQLNIIKYIGGIIITLLIGYLFAHFFK